MSDSRTSFLADRKSAWQDWAPREKSTPFFARSVPKGKMIGDLPDQRWVAVWRLPEKYPYQEEIVERLRYAALTLQTSIEIDPQKRGGIPVIIGTRFTISQLLAEIAEGQAIDEIAEDFDLDKDTIHEILHMLSICLDRPFFK